ncbi:MAG: tRNA (guanosine(37)-N1)-methyltransferase TrmD [Chloroflexota bacterium]|nr:tRNA (guanosine(37)-N1)-methyltransferase TrmD [Chloroflexota bacterium]
MRIDILTLFPEMFAGPFDYSIIKRARDAGIVDLWLHNIRDYTHDRHHVVDDAPYGGGDGMVMKPEPVFEAVEAVRSPDGRVILLSPQGKPFDQAMAARLAGESQLVLVCGRYEGVDERVSALADEELSIGDYVLSGGEPAAIVVVDAMVRLLPGAIGAEGGAAADSHASGLLEYPQYTRPAEYRGMRVPEVLISGNHAEVARWRRREALRRTLLRRPDMLARAELTEEDQRFLEGLSPRPSPLGAPDRRRTRGKRR